jgi:hypothetical protein
MCCSDATEPRLACQVVGQELLVILELQRGTRLKALGFWLQRGIRV